MNLDTKIAGLNKIGKRVSKKLEKLGVITAKDLLYYFPFRYDDFSEIKKISELKEGEQVSIKVKVSVLSNRRSFKTKKIITECLVTDGSESLRVIWFNQPFIKKMIRTGDDIYLSGKVGRDMLGLQFVSPVYEKIKKNSSSTHTARLVPVYPLTAGITQKQIRFLVECVLDLSSKIKDWVVDEIKEDYDFLDLPMALVGIHFPEDKNHLSLCLERLKFDELFLLQLQAELARKNKQIQKAPVLNLNQEKIKEFVKSLPFILTKSQKISAWEILKDLERDVPMNRLLCGDVGSGKTVVAGIGILSTYLAYRQAGLNKYQSALMAPTEILAFQHYDTLKKLFSKKYKILLLTGSKIDVNFELENTSKAGIKREVKNLLKQGEIDIVVGTHAVLSEGIEFKNLGLVIVDEQHRFGVKQRKDFKNKGERVHFLSMTATPIPRSLALLVYGDLDVSIINELPEGRKKIATRLVEVKNRNKAYDFIKNQVKIGRQVFVVCPLIVEKEESEKKTVMTEYKKLSEEIFPDLNIGYLHGKLKSEDKEKIMQDFKNKKIDILVSTSVIEVGVDIPNASVMMIEDADRFGLAQLHQFRGRVGRSVFQSYCFLFTNSKNKKTLDRLEFFEKNSDGFKLAEKDLETRGPGEVYGHTQSGLTQLQLAKLTDKEIIKKAREAAKNVVKDLGNSKYKLLVEKIKDWEDNAHLE